MTARSAIFYLRNNFCGFVDFRFCYFNSQDFNLSPVLLPFLPKGENNRRYSTMKEFQKGILDSDKVITAENVQRMGEVIALCAIKTVIVRGGKDLHYLYKGLLRDVNRSENDVSRYSDGYEIAQEAMLFLCQHMGKRLDDVYVTKTGRKITIKQACFSVADRYLAKNFVAPMLNTTSLNEQIMTEPEIIDDEQKNDYTAYDGLISKMHLTAVEYETLSILMAGFTMLQIGKILNVNRTTIWRRQNSIRKKYMRATNSHQK